MKVRIKQHYEREVLKINGKNFELFFCSIMKAYYGRDFRPVKEHGVLGDFGCDGYIKQMGLFFQVYSPEFPQQKLQSACHKMRKDFDRIYAEFHKKRGYCVDGYAFVINDKFQGVSQIVYDHIDTIKEDYNLDFVDVFGVDEIYDFFFKELERSKQLELLRLDSFDNDECMNVLKNFIYKNNSTLNKIISLEFEGDIVYAVDGYKDIVKGFLDELHFIYKVNHMDFKPYVNDLMCDFIDEIENLYNTVKKTSVYYYMGYYKHCEGQQYRAIQSSKESNIHNIARKIEKNYEAIVDVIREYQRM